MIISATNFRRLIRASAAAGIVLAAGCGERFDHEPTRRAKPSDPIPAPRFPQGMKQAIFRQPILVITELERPVRPPVAGIASRETLRSDAEDIVAIMDDGALIARREGATLVRSLPNPSSVLRVEVRAIRKLRFDPPVLELAVEQAASFRLLADGAPIDTAAADWTTSDIHVARQEGSFIVAGRLPGAARVTAFVGSVRASLDVRVAQRDEKLNWIAPKKLRAGELKRFEVQGAPAEVEWNSSRSAVLAHVGRGVFHAVGRGRATVCATLANRKRCSSIEVTP